MDELSEEDKLTVARARKIQRFLSQPFQVAEVFTGHAGKLVTMEQTIAGFTEILSGKYDHLPEVAFYMVGDISEVCTNFRLRNIFIFVMEMFGNLGGFGFLQHDLIYLYNCCKLICFYIFSGGYQGRETGCRSRCINSQQLLCI